MTERSTASSVWVWPIKIENYDRNQELNAEEKETLDANPSCFAEGVPPSIVIEKCGFPRLMKPIEDVAMHIELHKKYWPHLKAVMVRDMATRGRTFWGWTKSEWIESINNGGHEKPSIAAIAYVLCGFDSLHELGRYNFLFYGLAIRVFGRARIRQLFAEVEAMLREWGYRDRTARIYVPRAMCSVLITNRSPRLEDLTVEVLETVMQRRIRKNNSLYLSAISKVLAHRKIISAPVMRMERRRHPNPHLLKGVPEEWLEAANYWRENAHYTRRVRQATYYLLLAVGRWLAAKHPTITRPEQWDRKLAVECLAMITNMRCGDWRAPWVGQKPRNYGKPLTPNGRILNYTALRVFFADLQEWGLIPPRFDPYRSLRPPRSVKVLVPTTPRVIADDVWAKLLWAGLNITPEDFASRRNPNGQAHTYYPIEMIRAVTVVWLFAGIRGDEIRRLRLGCVTWQEGNGSSVCFLDVPVNKTATAFTKPVDGIVGQAINAWEKVRPAQEKLCDDKTGEMVDFLFLHRMRPLGEFFLNHFLIPRLCRKAGVPQHDLGGKITGHRARSTIPTQLFNAKEPMSLYELQEWLGHRMLSSTQRYAKITPTKLMKSYADAGYFSRNLRAIEVLIDQEKVRSGLTADEAWKFYDLGHGYCTYDFFDQCPHRMACAKCSFYMPKGSTAAALLEGKRNLLRMRQEIPLSDAELAALDDGVSALDSLLSRLADVPTPAGPTPLQLRETAPVQIEGAD
jgi:integrase